MKRLTHNYPWYKGNPEDQRAWMREFADAGERYIVLNYRLLGEACKDPACLIDFHAEMRNFGLDFADAHAPWGTWIDPGMPLEAWHEQVILRHRIAIRLCAQFGIDTLTFHTGSAANNIFGKNLKLDDYRNMLIRSMEELLPDAEKSGVILALENVWNPLNHSRVLLEIMEYFRSPHLGLCYDSGHGNLMEKGMSFPDKTCVSPAWDNLCIPIEWEENLIEKMAPWMVNCHLHDNNGFQDEHRLPGEGTVDWGRIEKELRKAPRLQNIQNESNPHNNTIQQICTVFRELIKEL